MGIVIDSTAFIGAERAGRSVIEILSVLAERFGDQEAAISVMSAYELLHGVWRASTPQIRAKREGFVEEILWRVPVRPVTLRVARIAAQIDAQCRSRGFTVPMSDLLIASTALDLDFAVVTGNLRHFNEIQEVQVLEFS